MNGLGQSISRKKALRTLGALVFAALLIYRGVNLQQQSIASNGKPATNAMLGTYKVQKVIDGDTIELNIDGRTQKVRLIGMDTPEVVDPRKVVQCFGREASAQGHKRLEGQTIRLEYDVQVGEHDKYGRLLAYVFLSDGSNYAEGMIRDGYAHEYTYQNQAYKYQATFKSAEAEAQAANRGFWAPETCSGDTKQAAK